MGWPRKAHQQNGEGEGHLDKQKVVNLDRKCAKMKGKGGGGRGEGTGRRVERSDHSDQHALVPLVAFACLLWTPKAPPLPPPPFPLPFPSPLLLLNSSKPSPLSAMDARGDEIGWMGMMTSLGVEEFNEITENGDDDGREGKERDDEG